MTRQLTARGEQRRRDLIELATRRFAEKGYHPTSVAELVEGLGVGKGVFYWYFSSKEELFRAILREAQLDLRRKQREALAHAEDPLARIGAGIHSSVHWSAQNPDLVRLVAFAWTDDRFASMLRRGEQVALDDVAAHVSDAMQRGLVADGDPLLLAQAMIGVTTSLTRQLMRGSTAGPPAQAAVETAAQGAVRFCINGLVGAGADQEVEIVKKSRDSVLK